MNRMIFKTRNLVFLILIGMAAGIISCHSAPMKTIDASKLVVDHYTCPMHPEINSDKPGECPKCGMALVPVYHK